MKKCTGILLILGVSAVATFGQSVEQVMKERRRTMAGWLVTVRTAQTKYKSEHGVYGDLVALRNAHLLGALVFESDTSLARYVPNLVPKNTHFEVTAPENGKHYRVTICESFELSSSEQASSCVHADENGVSSSGGRSKEWRPSVEDGPYGPLLSTTV